MSDNIDTQRMIVQLLSIHDTLLRPVGAGTHHEVTLASSGMRTVTTLISHLAPISYKEDPGENRSLEYIEVQIKILRWLETNAADTLTPERACFWTQRIAPEFKAPWAIDVVKLCYFMRSLGFDTFAQLIHGQIHLFVRSRPYRLLGSPDVRYWSQKISDNDVLYKATEEALINRMDNARAPQTFTSLRGGASSHPTLEFSARMASRPSAPGVRVPTNDFRERQRAAHNLRMILGLGQGLSAQVDGAAADIEEAVAEADSAEAVLAETRAAAISLDAADGSLPPEESSNFDNRL